MTIKQEFFIERQGQTFVKYAGILDEAHEQGLKSITTTLLQIPNGDNRNTAICQAVVETSKGIFTGIGDAAPDNVSRAMQNCLIRMAETRAKARALRDAINVGAAALEELDGEVGEEGKATPTADKKQPTPINRNNSGSTTTPSESATKSKVGVVTQPQLNKIFALASSVGFSPDEMKRELQTRYHVASSKDLTSQQASHCIQWLSSKLESSGAAKRELGISGYDGNIKQK